MDSIENLKEELVKKEEYFNLLETQFKTVEKKHYEITKEITKYQNHISLLENKLTGLKEDTFYDIKCQDVTKNISDISWNLTKAQIFLTAEKELFDQHFKVNTKKCEKVDEHQLTVPNPEELQNSISVLKNEITNLKKEVSNIK